MNNSEKKNYITEIHKRYMLFRTNDNDPINTKQKKEDEYWEIYKADFYNRIPDKLYKYRMADEQNIENFKNNIAWFSKPVDFGDVLDSTINNDIESELEEFEKNPKIFVKNIIIPHLLAPFVKKIDTSMVDQVLAITDNQGKFNELDFIRLAKNFSPNFSDEYLAKVFSQLQTLSREVIRDCIKDYLMFYANFNKNVRENTYVYCLTEDNDTQLMWETYAGGDTGFCIEYSFPTDTLAGQRVLTNLFPIYYGEKEQIKFLDILKRGFFSKKKINGVAYQDYTKWFLSMLTKDPTYINQKEWRVIYAGKLGANKQIFPFVKSIILGQKISETNKNTLINIAKEKGIDVYQRILNSTGSKVLVKKLDII